MDKFELLEELLRSKATEYETLIALWETDLKKYGATEDLISEYRGRSCGLIQAADLLKKVSLL